MIKTCIIARGLTKGGVYRYVHNLLKELDQLQNNDLSIELLHNDSRLLNNFKQIKGVYFKTQNKFLFDYYFSTKQLCKQNYDFIIYTKNVIPLNHHLLSARKLNIITDLGYFEKSGEVYPFLDTLFMKAFMKHSCVHSDKVLAISEFTKSDIVERFGINESKIRVIDGGVEDDFRLVEDEHLLYDFKIQHKLPEPFILFLGSASPRKNLHNLLIAFNKIKHKVPHNLIITGNKDYYSKETKSFIDENLSNRVIFLGYVDDSDLVYLYNLADLLVYPSLYEGFGLPILEAQACGCPVLTSNITSMPYAAGKGAVLIDPHDPIDMANNILSILSNSDLRNELIRKGFLNIQRFSWQKTANELIKIITTS